MPDLTGEPRPQPDYSDIFKTCQFCSERWNNRIDFLTDARVTLTGYLPDFVSLEEGCFVFEHHCGSRMVLNVSELSDLYGGPIFEERKIGSEQCPGFCLHGEELRPCPVECECAYVREILQLFACQEVRK